MDNEKATCSGQTVLFAFLGGAIAGAIAGILFAPKSGEETRREVKGYARKAEEDLIEKAKEARAALDDVIERGKHFVTETRADVEAAVKAGKEAMQANDERYTAKFKVLSDIVLRHIQQEESRTFPLAQKAQVDWKHLGKEATALRDELMRRIQARGHGSQIKPPV